MKYMLSIFFEAISTVLKLFVLVFLIMFLGWSKNANSIESTFGNVEDLKSLIIFFDSYVITFTIIVALFEIVSIFKKVFIDNPEKHNLKNKVEVLEKRLSELEKKDNT